MTPSADDHKRRKLHVKLLLQHRFFFSVPPLWTEMRIFQDFFVNMPTVRPPLSVSFVDLCSAAVSSEMLPKVETRVVLVGEAGRNNALLKALEVRKASELSSRSLSLISWRRLDHLVQIFTVCYSIIW